ncbi:MAG: transposase [Planctomycetota bacterium]|nr:transposase [Planctomycetota bacterium]
MSVTIQQLLQEHFDGFAARQRLSPDMFHAAVQMRDCRTAAMGGHVNSCPDGHFHEIAYNSCRHRCCPQCNGLTRARWLEGWQQRLLPCPHYHLIFTTAHELLPLWRYNKEVFANKLFEAASQSLRELLDDPRYLGARAGLLAALHTWSQMLAGHVHLHVLCTAGGLDDEGNWIEPKKSCLLPRQVLMRKFRGKFCALLRKALDKGELQVPPDTTAARLRGLLNRLGRRTWNVKILPRYDHASGVATYLARYLKGGPIGNRRLLAVRDGRVLFRYRMPGSSGMDRARQVIASLSVDEFLGRLLEHVPPRRFQTVRGYGLYSGNQHSRLDQAYRALGQVPPEQQPPLSWQELCERAGHPEAGKCPVCGKALIAHHHFERGRSPPRLATLSLSDRKGAA